MTKLRTQESVASTVVDSHGQDMRVWLSYSILAINTRVDVVGNQLRQVCRQLVYERCVIPLRAVHRLR